MSNYPPKTNAFDAARYAIKSLQECYQRSVDAEYTELDDVWGTIEDVIRTLDRAVNNATVEELQAILGPSWAICKNTPKNRERYSNIITRKQYEKACAEALARRKLY